MDDNTFVVVAHWLGDSCEVEFRANGDSWIVKKEAAPYPIVTVDDAKMNLPDLSELRGTVVVHKSDDMQTGVTGFPPLWPEIVVKSWSLWPSSTHNRLRADGWSLQSCRKMIEDPDWPRWRRTMKMKHLPSSLQMVLMDGNPEIIKNEDKEWPGVYVILDKGEYEIVTNTNDVVEYHLTKSAGFDGTIRFKKSVEVMKPYPNEHACPMNDPEGYERFRRGKRRSGDKTYSVIWGKLKGEDKWEEQSYRYNKETWTEGDAYTHCESHGGTSFEPARKDGVLKAIRKLFSR